MQIFLERVRGRELQWERFGLASEGYVCIQYTYMCIDSHIKWDMVEVEIVRGNIDV